MENVFGVLKGKGDLRLERQPVPEPKPNEVVVRMNKLGVCGSDVSLWSKGRLGDLDLSPPMGVGHEGSGTVLKCGRDVTHLKPGDRVALDPSTPCRKCELCTESKYHLCEQSSFHGFALIYPGMLARYFVQDADFAYKLPDAVSDEEGALIEPLSVVIHSCRRGGVRLGSSVLITGAGPIGLLCLLTAKAMGATNIMVTDVKESRIAKAKELGADHTLLVGTQSPQQLAGTIKAKMGVMPDTTLECSGSEPGLAQAIYATNNGGTIVLVGILAPEVKLPLVHAGMRELNIRGVYRYMNCYPVAINMIAKGLVNVKPLITHRFQFEDFQKAFDLCRSGEEGIIKSIISFQ